MKKVNLSAKFRGILTDIYNQIDLDESGGLSRQEFNLFNWRTSGEEVQVNYISLAESSVDKIFDEISCYGMNSTISFKCFRTMNGRWYWKTLSLQIKENYL